MMPMGYAGFHSHGGESLPLSISPHGFPRRSAGHFLQADSAIVSGARGESTACATCRCKRTRRASRLDSAMFFQKVLSSYEGKGFRGLFREHPSSVLRISVNDPILLADTDRRWIINVVMNDLWKHTKKVRHNASPWIVWLERFSSLRS